MYLSAYEYFYVRAKFSAVGNCDEMEIYSKPIFVNEISQNKAHEIIQKLMIEFNKNIELEFYELMTDIPDLNNIGDYDGIPKGSIVASIKPKEGLKVYYIPHGYAIKKSNNERLQA